MLREAFPEGVENEQGPPLFARHMFPRHDEQFCVHLLHHTACEVRSGALVHRHGNRATENATEEGGDPLGRVGTPEQDAVARPDSARLKLPGELSCQACALAIRPPCHAVAATLAVSDAVTVPAISGKVFDQGAARHYWGCSNSYGTRLRE